MTDLFKLQRFLDAQSFVYPRVLDELRCGRKQSHWIPSASRTRTQREGAAFCHLLKGGGYRLSPA
jgi:uncharacterized protein (DUF1810 family)